MTDIYETITRTHVGITFVFNSSVLEIFNEKYNAMKSKCQITILRMISNLANSPIESQIKPLYDANWPQTLTELVKTSDDGQVQVLIHVLNSNEGMLRYDTDCFLSLDTIELYIAWTDIKYLVLNCIQGLAFEQQGKLQIVVTDRVKILCAASACLATMCVDRAAKAHLANVALETFTSLLSAPDYHAKLNVIKLITIIGEHQSGRIKLQKIVPDIKGVKEAATNDLEKDQGLQDAVLRACDRCTDVILWKP
eukprot:Clim_evm3s145 gene=Clim_evmTU3s145